MSQADTDALRRFGIVFAFVIVIVSNILLPWLFDIHLPHWPLWLGAGVCGIALMAPRQLEGLHGISQRLWQKTRRLLIQGFFTLIFFLVIVPWGLFRQLASRRRRQVPPSTPQSFRQNRRHRLMANDMEKPD